MLLDIILMIITFISFGAVWQIWHPKDEQKVDNKSGATIILIAVGVICMHFISFIEVAYIFLIMFMIMLIALPIGLIKPDLVIRWGENKTRKQVFKIYGIGIILSFFLMASTIPAPTMEEKIGNARDYLQEKNFSMAISEYESVFENWDDTTKYSKDKINEELIEAKIEYSKELVAKAKTNYKNNKLDNARNNIDQAKNLYPDNELISDIENKIVIAENKIKADKHLDKTLEYIEQNDYEKAATELSKASNLVQNYEKVKEVKNQIKDELDQYLTQNLDNAVTALDKWNVKEAEEYINTAENLFSNNSKIENVKEILVERKKTISLIGEKPENSEWDGAVRPVTEYLRRHLKDPDSVEYIEWSPVHITYVEGQPFWRVRVKYRAKNSFGGYVIEEQLAYIVNDQVVALENFN